MNTIALTLLNLLTEGLPCSVLSLPGTPKGITMMLLEGLPCAVLTVQKKIMKLEKGEKKMRLKRQIETFN
ncbi:hypothetical protein A3860_34795 [Niastella vici]|uniref:Uncharacterized protein n=1 Tax=Niastella vici TaxID=1703345 RepID=A0A1V9FP34_9BACT|nr:hypothetical protein A3860_34795 [Niastella vici]